MMQRKHLITLKEWPAFEKKLFINITKTYLYNFDPLKPHFYIVKLGFTGVYIIFVISAQKHRLWVLVRTTRRPTIYVLSRNMKKFRFFLSEKLPLFGGKIFNIFEWAYFRNVREADVYMLEYTYFEKKPLFIYWSVLP